MSYSLLILPGDGIGPEVMAEVRKVIAWFEANRGMTFDVSEDLVGGCAYDAHGVAVLELLQRQLQVAIAQAAERAHDIRPDVDAQGAGLGRAQGRFHVRDTTPDRDGGRSGGLAR